MPTGKLGQRRQVVIPKEICKKLRLEEGDFVEVTRVQGQVINKAKKLVAAAEVLTPAQRATIDRRLAEGLEDIKQGRVCGPFESVATMLCSLHGARTAKKRQPSKTRSCASTTPIASSAAL